MSNEDREKRLKELEDFAFNIDKIVKQPESVSDEEVILNAPRETTSQPGHATARQAKATPSGREQSANTKKVQQRLDPPPSGRHSSTKISRPWGDWSWRDLDGGDYLLIYLVGCFPFAVVIAIYFMSTDGSFGVDPDTSLLILIPPFFFSLTLSIFTVVACAADEDSPWLVIYYMSIFILIPVASGIIFWQSSFSADFYGQVLLVILTIGPVFGTGLMKFGTDLCLDTIDKSADLLYKIRMLDMIESFWIFLNIYNFFSFFILIPLVTLSFISGFHLEIGSFFDLLTVCFMLIFMVVLSIICSLSWPLIVVDIIWGLFNSGSFPTSLSDISFLPFLLQFLSSR